MRTPLPKTVTLPSELSGSAVAEETEEVNPFEAAASTSRSMSRDNTPRPRKARVTSEASSVGSMADTPCGTDASDYDTDIDSAAHTFNAGTANGNDATQQRRDSVASSTTSEDLDAEDDAPAPNSYISSESNFGTNTTASTGNKPHIRSKHDFDAWYFRQDTIIFQNFDPLRATDFAFGLAIIYLGAAFVLPYLNDKQQLAAFFVNALLWRIGHTFVLGSILKAQSERKWLVRHYLSELLQSLTLLEQDADGDSFLQSTITTKGLAMALLKKLSAIGRAFIT